MLDTMSRTHDKYASSGFESGIGALAAGTMNSFDWFAAQCLGAGARGDYDD